MAIVDEIERIKTNIANIYTEAENKGATIIGERNSDNLANVVTTIPTGSSITKGVIIQECLSSGYASEVKIVGMTSLPAYAFYVLSVANAGLLNKSIREIDLTDGTIVSIGMYACAGCTTLLNVKMSANLTSISTYAFNGCTNLALTELPDTVSSISSYAFNGCTKLALTKLPSAIKVLDTRCFTSCPALKITEIPANVSTLSSYAFSGCSGITSLRYLTTISIGTGVFNGCSNLTTFIIPNTTGVIQLAYTNAFSSTPIASGTGFIYVPDDLVASYQSATNWSTYASQIKGISELG